MSVRGVLRRWNREAFDKFRAMRSRFMPQTNRLLLGESVEGQFTRVTSAIDAARFVAGLADARSSRR